MADGFLSVFFVSSGYPMVSGPLPYRRKRPARHSWL